MSSAFFDHIRAGNVEKVKEMIAVGTDVNAVECECSVNAGECTCCDFYTPLTLALEKKNMTGHEDMVKTLIDAGADVNRPHFCGLTPLMMAAKNCRITVMLLNAGADVDVRGKGLDERTALMFACEDGCECVVALLLLHGANPDLVDRMGYTAMMFADGYGHTMIHNMLVKAGAQTV